MNWAIVAQLIIEIGLPAAQRIVAQWEKDGAVTTEELNAIRAEADQKAVDRLRAMALQAGFELDDKRVQDLLALARG